MAFDFKKEYKEFYMPKNKPEIVTVPKANYIAVRGKGNPNDENGAYKKAVGVLYSIAYTLKMSYKTDHKIEGFFDYVVPPLEGFWWQEGVDGIDYSDKSTFCWISLIRVPDFITKKDFEWAVETASNKKKLDCSSAEFLSIDEGLCVQVMHIGPFDDEPATVLLMDEFLAENGYENDFSEERLHHEIYLSDARRVSPEKWKTVIRHPVRRKTTEKQIAYCGLDCFKCDAKIATVNNNDVLREKTAKPWSELNGFEITKEMINCMGCIQDGVKTCFCENMCEIRKCAAPKRVTTCADCAEFRVCEKLRMITDNSIEAKENLKL